MPYYRTTVDPELLPEFLEAGRRVLGTDNYDTLLGVLNGSDGAFKDQLLKAFDELRHEKKNRSGRRTITELIEAAHLLVFDLLRTEVTAFDVTTALEKRCETWDEPDRDAALRIAQQFAEVKGMALLLAKEESPERTEAQKEHHLFVAYELGDFLDLPVDYEWTDEMREKSYLSRTVLYPLDPDDD
jgi:hypothetical protein